MTENHFRSHFSPFQINTPTFYFFSQNGSRRTFWRTENHFRSHFSPFQINTPTFLFFFHKMAAGGHFGGPKITFECISRHFRSIRNFFLFFFSKWLIRTILDDRKKISKWPPSAILEVRVAPKTIGFFHYVLSMAMPNMKLISEFMTQLETPQAF